jgi:hypothetical protein
MNASDRWPLTVADRLVALVAAPPRVLAPLQEARMTELEELSQIVCRHQWPSVERWAESVRRLGELSDKELGELERVARTEGRAAA